MAKKKFILQGFTSDTHVESVARLLALPDVENAIVSVAFANARGVALLKQGLSKLGSRATLFVGIRNEITTKQGLAALLDLSVKLFAVDTGGRSPLYHPKLYFARSKTKARLIVGSANFTQGGLNNNIEASLSLDLDLGLTDDKELAKSIETEFKKLPVNYPKHVLRISKVKEIVALEQSGRLLDEALSDPPNPILKPKGNKADQVPRIKLLVKALRGALPTPGKIKAAKAKAKPASQGPVSPTYVPVWEMQGLTRRDLTIPAGPNTNATGSINLDKGELPDGVDFRDYFRDVVFPNLQWGSAGTTVETAVAIFRLVVKNIDNGEFTTVVRHSTDKSSTTYKQRNAMTRLSWGPMQNLVRREDLIGRSLRLYANTKDNSRFLIEID